MKTEASVSSYTKPTMQTFACQAAHDRVVSAHQLLKSLRRFGVIRIHVRMLSLHPLAKEFPVLFIGGIPYKLN